MFVLLPESKRRFGWYRLQRFFLAFSTLSLWALVWLFATNYFGALSDRGFDALYQLNTYLEGCGMRFGCKGPSADAVTSPLYFLIRLTSAWLGIDPYHWGQWLNVVAMGAAMTLYLRMASAHRWHGQNLKAPILAGLGLVLLFGSDHWLLQGAVSGTEIGLACLAIALVIRAAADAHQTHLSYWLALALLLRPEALIFCIAAPLFFARARQLRFWWPIASSFGLILLFLALWGEGVGWGALFGESISQHGPGVAHLLGLPLEYPWILLAPVTLLVPALPRLVRYVLLCALLWFVVQLYHHSGFALNYNAIPVLLPLITLGWIGAFVLLDKLATLRDWPNWAHVILPWTAIIAALMSMSFYWHSHHLPPQATATKNLRALTTYLKRTYHPTRPIATTIPGQLKRLTRRPITPITVKHLPAWLAKPGYTPPKPTGLQIHPNPDTIILSLSRKNFWNERGAPKTLRPVEKKLIELSRSGLIDYKIESVKLKRGLHWLILRKVETVKPAAVKK